MRQMAASLGLFSLFVNVSLAPAVEFTRQTIAVSSDPGYRLVSHLRDIDDDGLRDMLALVLLPREVQVYRQRKSGFATVPDQRLPLPEKTAWISLHDIDPRPGDELLFSTSAGVVYLRQEQGVFESSSQTLVQTQQVFTTDYPRVLATLPEWGDANDVVPITFADRAVLYEEVSLGEWHPGRTFDLKAAKTEWRTYHDDWWTMGSSPSYQMTIQRMFRAGLNDGQAQERQVRDAEIERLLTRIEKDRQWRYHRVRRKGINNDGREDLILWQQRGDISPKTTVLIFLRRANGQLPATPTRVVRSNGLPIRTNREHGISPLWDLDGDGKCELILVALKTRLTSWSGLVDMFLGGGVDWVFTVCSGRDGRYSGGPDFRMDVTSNLPREDSIASLFRIDGDFNGDGREDLLVERTPERFDVYLSSVRTGFFREGAPLTFEAPVEARRVETDDLNGDGISDLFVQRRDKAHITVFLSQSGHQKGNRR